MLSLAGLIFAGPPYIVLSCWLVLDSRNHSVQWLKINLIFAPIALLPLIVIWIFFISGGDLNSILLIGFIACMYALPVGYFFVILIFFTCAILQRYGFVEREPSPKTPE